MNVYVRAFLVWGIIIPILLHAIAPAAMPWWPDTVSTGIAAGFTAIVIVWKTRTDQSLNGRVWKALRAIGSRRPGGQA